MKKMMLIWASILPVCLFGAPAGITHADIMRPYFECYNEPEQLIDKYDSSEFNLAYRFFLSKEEICVTLLVSPGPCDYEVDGVKNLFGDKWWPTRGVVEIVRWGKDEKTRISMNKEESVGFLVEMGYSEFFNLSEQRGRFEPHAGMLGGSVLYAERIYDEERSLVYRIVEESTPSIFVRKKLLEIVSKAEE